LITIFINNVSLLGGVCYICWLVSKLITIYMICKYSKLTDKKVEYITKMIGKNK
jgi:hypothetical protein